MFGWTIRTLRTVRGSAGTGEEGIIHKRPVTPKMITSGSQRR
jgi:hypothetical protein